MVILVLGVSTISLQILVAIYICNGSNQEMKNIKISSLNIINCINKIRIPKCTEKQLKQSNILCSGKLVFNVDFGRVMETLNSSYLLPFFSHNFIQ